MSAIDEIKQRLDIVDVVSDYVTLRKSGRSFKALCPFHTEKTPSFFVFPERQSWRCFGSCATGGDIFSFVMKKEGIDFGQALRLLAERAGVTLVSKQQGKAEEEQWERLYQANDAAAHYYHHLLLNTKTAEKARSHLEGRGVAQETMASFQLGFSPNSWDALCNYLIDKGYGEDQLLAAGLIVEKEGGGRRDLFRNRLMFPIRNAQGAVVGFGGRTLDGTMPKYLNSPQTAIFDKSGILYGIDRAQGAIREQGLAIIVEGYMDVIAAHQQGITNVVASMGTSLTEKQMMLIKKLTRNLTLALDADAAGEEATLRGLEIARRAFSERLTSVPDWLGGTSRLKANLRIILLPQGMDPDEVIRESPETWRQLVVEAVPLMDYFFKAVTSKFDISREEDKAFAAEQLLPLISEIEDAVERELYLKRLAGLIGVSEKTLAARAAELRPTKRERARRAVSLSPAQPFRHPLEEYCLCLLLQHPELRERGEQLLPEYFESTENRELFLAWHDSLGMEMLRQSLDVNLHHHLDSLINRALPPASESEFEAAFVDCLRRLEEQRLRRLKALEEVLIAEAESEGDRNVITEPVETLLQKALKPSTQLKDVFEKGRREQEGAQQ
ncbi:MAG: DNA primase [Dehalococcoidia bacterium]|jgi:DNA primase|nr:DNA primase [Chloroflexota bacterium]MCK4242726.1 DNA primase [Dehalococcoidia bacterium]